MIKRILKLLAQENLSFNEIADKLNLSRSELNNRFELMEHMGYIEKSCDTLSNDNDSCSVCRKSNDCSEQEKSKHIIIVYKLTAKGTRVSQK